MKTFPDIEQSKKLAEILPIESADLYYDKHGDIKMPTNGYFGNKKYFKECPEDTPCWSLAALLEQLPIPSLVEDKIGNGKTGWMVSVYPDNARSDSAWHNNPVDACVEMILKLK